MNEKAVIPAVLYGLDSVQDSGYWISPLHDVLKGIHAPLAVWKPAPDIASIWEIVKHITGWTAYMTRWLAGEQTGDNEDWPLLVSFDEDSWQMTLTQLWSTLTSFREQIAALDPAGLFAPPKRKRTVRYHNIVNILIHNAYHTGQIAKLHALYRAARKSSRKSEETAVL